MNNPFLSSSRRQFLKNAGAAGGALAWTPYLLPKLYGQSSANDRLNVACIGVGGRGSGIADQAASLGQLIACCDVHKGNAQKFVDGQKEKGRSCTIYTDYREMLDKEKGVDVVTIGTPDHWHVKIAIDAMASGKHVYCEKPLTLSIQEGEIIQAAVKKYNKIFQVGTQQRSEFDMNFLKAVAIAHSGRLGNNLEAVSSVGTAASRSPDPNKPFGPFDTAKIPENLNWDIWLGPAPMVEFCPERIGWNFRWWFEYSGGQVTDWGVHHTDIAFWALAGEGGQAIEAQGTGKFMAVDREQVRDFLLGKVSPKAMPHAYNVAHSFDVDVKLTTGNTIKIVSGQNNLHITGERGRIRVNRGSLTGKPVEEIAADPKAAKEIEELMAKLYGGNLPNPKLGHMSNFFDCVKNGKAPVANVPDHVRAVNACHLANIALLLDRKVTYNPTTKKFENDGDADQLTKRSYREGYQLPVV